MDLGCKAVHQEIEKEGGQDAPLSNARAQPLAVWWRRHQIPDESLDSNVVQSDQRRFHPQSVERLLDLNKGHKRVRTLTNKPTSVRTPTEPALGLADLSCA